MNESQWNELGSKQEVEDRINRWMADEREREARRKQERAAKRQQRGNA